jgi:hypothetical protein
VMRVPRWRPPVVPSARQLSYTAVLYWHILPFRFSGTEYVITTATSDWRNWERQRTAVKDVWSPLWLQNCDVRKSTATYCATLHLVALPQALHHWLLVFKKTDLLPFYIRIKIRVDKSDKCVVNNSIYHMFDGLCIIQIVTKERTPSVISFVLFSANFRFF